MTEWKTTCAKTLDDGFSACHTATSEIQIPGAPNASDSKNVNARRFVCSIPEGQLLIETYRTLIKLNCSRAIQESMAYPHGLHTTAYCLPWTQPSIVACSPSPVPIPSGVKHDPSRRLEREMSVRTGSAAADSSQSSDIVPHNVQVPAPTTSGPTKTLPTTDTTSMKVAIVICGVVIAVLVVMIVLFVRRLKMHEKQSAIVSSECGGGFRGMSDAATDDASTRGSSFQAAKSLIAFQISYKKLHFGEVVSHGGYGEVVRGVYNNEVVAIKRLLPARRRDQQCIAAFIKEVQLTATLDHECIVKFIGVAWDSPATTCMVSEYMHGGDLRQLLTQYARNHHPNGHDDLKLRMAVEIAHDLTNLHSLDTPVVHRDLKSRNILLTESLDTKLIDFGISTERQDVTMTAGVGTSLWMAPEVMLEHRYNEKADIFSFGVILSELDTHQLPYDHARTVQSNQKMPNVALMQMVAEGKIKPHFSEQVDHAMVDLATDCLQLDPTARPTAAEVLYRIHRVLHCHQKVSDQTRTAIDKSLRTLELTRATQRTQGNYTVFRF